MNITPIDRVTNTRMRDGLEKEARTRATSGEIVFYLSVPVYFETRVTPSAVYLFVIGPAGSSVAPYDNPKHLWEGGDSAISTDDPITARLDRLLALTPVPPWAGAHDWPRMEAELGFTLPAEYKAYADRFPSGKLRRLEVFHPDGPDGFGLVQQVTRYASIFTGDSDRTFYPEPGGPIPWAEFEASVVLCWLPADNNSDTWPVIAYASGGLHETVPGSTLEALIAVLRGDAAQGVFGDALYEDPLTFEPFDLHISAQFGITDPDDLRL